MGIAGACANYFFDEFASIPVFFSLRLLACAEGEDIGSVALEFAHADPGDPGQLPVVVGSGLGDRHQRLVGEDAEGGLSAALRLDRAPLAQSLVETLVHV